MSIEVTLQVKGLEAPYKLEVASKTDLESLRMRFGTGNLTELLIETLRATAQKEFAQLAKAGATPDELQQFSARWTPGSVKEYIKLRKLTKGLSEADKAYLKRVL